MASLKITVPNFDPIFRATFIERPNRFLVRCRRVGREVVEAHMPNPGRLRELLLPKATLFLTATPGAHRKTQYTVLAVERDGAPVFLHTHVNNLVAGHLASRGRLPTLENAEVVATEITHGHSRFDYLLRVDGEEVFMEVKSVTLFGNGTAMFPDAITQRGRRHLLELADLGGRGAKPIVLFLIHTPRVSRFMPDYHTDLAFSETFLSVRDKLRIVAVSVGWTPQLRLRRAVKQVEIPWDYLAQEVSDQGVFLKIFRVEKTGKVAGPGGKTTAIERGYYVFVDDAENDLTKKLNRRAVDSGMILSALHRASAHSETLAIRSSTLRRCVASSRFAEILQPSTLHETGACPCLSHLFYSAADPLNLRIFHEVLENLRMPRAPR